MRDIFSKMRKSVTKIDAPIWFSNTAKCMLILRRKEAICLFLEINLFLERKSISRKKFYFQTENLFLERNIFLERNSILERNILLQKYTSEPH